MITLVTNKIILTQRMSINQMPDAINEFFVNQFFEEGLKNAKEEKN